MPDRECFQLRYDLQMNAESDEAEVLIYGRISNYRYGDSDPDVTAKDFDKSLKEAKAKGATRLTLRINSPGGAVYQAVAMRAMLINSGFEEINVKIEGLCASAATLLGCVPSAHVSIAEGAMYMIHNPSLIAWGDARVLEHEADRLRKIEADMQNIYSKRSGKSADDLKTLMDDETWFTAQEAVDAGFADELIDGSEAAACVSMSALDAMRSMYKHVPDEIIVVADESNPPTVSNAESGVASAPAPEHKSTDKEENLMDMKDITREQLMQERPDLFGEISGAGAEAERTRMQEIDELTPPGYEDMATEAKNSGESAMDYHKRIVKAQREKGADFLRNRYQETAGASAVAGGTPGDNDGDEEKTLEASAKEIASYAKAYRETSAGGMF